MSNDCPICLAGKIRARILAARFEGVAIPRPKSSSGPDAGVAPDDLYLLDAGSVMPIIEKLIMIVATADQLLNCAAEFSKDIACCAEYFQAADDKMHDLKAEVGYG